MTMVELKFSSRTRMPAITAFHGLLVAVAETWPLLDEDEQRVCAKAIREAFEPFFHEKLVDNLRGALHELVEAEKAATNATPCTILKFHADHSGRLTIATKEMVPREDVAERVAAHREA